MKEEQRKAASERMKAMHAKKREDKQELSDEQILAMSEAIKERNKAKKSADAKSRIRIGAGGKRDILSLPKRDDGFKYRLRNDVKSEIADIKARGYEVVTDEMQIGTSHVDGNNSNSGVVTRDVGNGINGVLMRQKIEWYNEDKSDKQRSIDESEEAMVRKKVNPSESTDGSYGEVKIG